MRICKKFFKAHNQKPMPKSSDVAVEVDYIRPSREFRRGLVYDLDEDIRVQLWNRLTQTDHVIHDMLECMRNAENDAAEGRSNIF